MITLSISNNRQYNFLHFVIGKISFNKKKIGIIAWLARFFLRFLNKELNELYTKIKGVLQIIKEEPNYITMKLLKNVDSVYDFLSKIYQKIKDVETTTKEEIEFIDILGRLCQALEEIQQVIMIESFKDNNPISNFSSSFNNWNRKEDNIWDKYYEESL